MHPEFEKLLALAYSDGVVSDEEKKILLSKADELGISQTLAELQIINYNSSGKEIKQIETEINSIEELENFLENLQSSSSPSWQSALEAQLQVLSYANSSELVGTTLDSLFKSIKNAKKYAKDEFERNQIMERGSIFIQNFVFFMHAKLIYAVDQNRKEGKELQKKAAKVLLKSVASAATAASGGPQVVAIQFGSSLVDEIVESDLFNRFIDYFNKKSENARKESEFLKSMTSLFDKLDRHFDTIGNCDVIAGLLRNYAIKVASNQIKELEEAIEIKSIQVSKSKSKIRNKPLLILGISLGIYLVRWLWHGFVNAEKFIERMVIEDTETVVQTSLLNWTEWHFIITLIILTSAGLYYFFAYRKELNIFNNLNNSKSESYQAALNNIEKIALKYDE